MNKVYLIIGSNLGDKFNNIEQANRQIGLRIGKILNSSSVYETEPWGIREQPQFLNLVLYLETNLKPLEILKEIDFIENALGRKKGKKWGARIIDIDILFFNDLIFKSGDLIIPHPSILERMFVLRPIAEIAADLVHPVLKKDIQELLKDCKDTLSVKEFKTTIRYSDV